MGNIFPPKYLIEYSLDESNAGMFLVEQQDKIGMRVGA